MIVVFLALLALWVQLVTAPRVRKVLLDQRAQRVLLVQLEPGQLALLAQQVRQDQQEQ